MPQQWTRRIQLERCVSGCQCRRDSSRRGWLQYFRHQSNQSNHLATTMQPIIDMAISMSLPVVMYDSDIMDTGRSSYIGSSRFRMHDRTYRGVMSVNDALFETAFISLKLIRGGVRERDHDSRAALVVLSWRTFELHTRPAVTI